MSETIRTQSNFMVQRGVCMSASAEGDQVFDDELGLATYEVPMIFVDGLLVQDVGDGTKTGSFYWSSDGGTTALDLVTMTDGVSLGYRLYLGSTGAPVSSANKIYISYAGNFC